MLFQIYGENAGYQLLGWVLVFAALVIANELSRRPSWAGSCSSWRCPRRSASTLFPSMWAPAWGRWALSNPTYLHMNSWFHYAKLYAATAGCIGL